MTDHELTQLFHEDAEAAALRDELEAWEMFQESEAASLAAALRRGGRPFAVRALEEIRAYFAGVTDEEPDDDRDLPF